VQNEPGDAIEVTRRSRNPNRDAAIPALDPITVLTEERIRLGRPPTSTHLANLETTVPSLVR
jgi:hypothetical protein